MMDYMFQKLTEAIKGHSNIIIMTHKKPDLDGMGSSIGLFKLISSMKKDACVLFPDTQINKSLVKGINLLESKSISINYKKESELKIDSDTLLIILDTQKPQLVESEELLEKVDDIFVIDHHMNSSDHINNTIFEYINSQKSSVAEIITEYYKHLNKMVDPTIATLMLAGLEIDTTSYNVKTKESTFRASAYLLKSGADLIEKQRLLKESKEDFVRRHDYIKNSEMIKDNIAICIMDEQIHDNVDLAMISDELLRLDNVEASFTIGKIAEDVVGVSARSIGNISVGNIMTEIGGGGHVTDAAAQIKAKTILEIKEIIAKVIMEGD